VGGDAPLNGPGTGVDASAGSARPIARRDERPPGGRGISHTGASDTKGASSPETKKEEDFLVPLFPFSPALAGATRHGCSRHQVS
jgi:hypothetical protein